MRLQAPMTRYVRLLSDLDALDEKSKCVNVVIETTRESRTKLAYDPERGTFVVKLVLPGCGCPLWVTNIQCDRAPLRTV